MRMWRASASRSACCCAGCRALLVAGAAPRRFLARCSLSPRATTRASVCGWTGQRRALARSSCARRARARQLLRSSARRDRAARRTICCACFHVCANRHRLADRATRCAGSIGSRDIASAPPDDRFVIDARSGQIEAQLTGQRRIRPGRRVAAKVQWLVVWAQFDEQEAR